MYEGVYERREIIVVDEVDCLTLRVGYTASVQVNNRRWDCWHTLQKRVQHVKSPMHTSIL